MGIVLGGALIGTTGAYRVLFIIDAISFVVFFAVVYFVIKETYRPQANKSSFFIPQGWATALSDRRFLIYLVINIIFTTYVSQLHSTLPLYLKNFISAIFAWHLALAIVCQLPVARILRRFTHPQALIVSALVWALGFISIWVTGFISSGQVVWTILSLGLFAIAIVSYTPSASSLVTDLAPESQRGVYFSLSSLCWAFGYFIGPPLGGWALDQSPQVANTFWLSLACSVIVTIAILRYLHRILRREKRVESRRQCLIEFGCKYRYKKTAMSRIIVRKKQKCKLHKKDRREKITQKGSLCII